MQARIHVGFDTALSPEGVVATLTDFSADRPAIWPTLDPDKYKVYELGATCAVVKEGTHRPDIWVRERYDWSTPGTVSWSLEASNVFRPGSRIEAVVTPTGSDGSHVELDAQRIAATPIGYVVVAGLAVFGRRFMLATYKERFGRIAAES